MSATTIKVNTQTRDRLKAQAAARHTTLGHYLEHLADLGDRQQRMTAMATAMSSTSAEELRDYRREVDEWADADLTTP